MDNKPTSTSPSSKGAAEEKRRVYWLIDDHFYYPSRQYVIQTEPGTSYEQLLSKVKSATGKQQDGYTCILNYSRSGNEEEKFENVIIDSDESMALAIEYFGDGAYDIKRGVTVRITLVDESWILQYMYK